MKVLFAIGSASVSEQIAKQYMKLYDEKIDYKDVFYFKAVIEEVKRNKSYDRIVIREELEPLQSNIVSEADKVILNNIDSITDEMGDATIILICNDNRTRNDTLLAKLYNLGVYNFLIGNDKQIINLCKIIKEPHGKKDAKEYLRGNVSDTFAYEEDRGVEESDILNTCRYFDGLNSKEDYLKSFARVVAQYDKDEDLSTICAALTTKLKRGEEIFDALSNDPRFAKYCTWRTNQHANEKKDRKIAGGLFSGIFSGIKNQDAIHRAQEEAKAKNNTVAINDTSSSTISEHDLLNRAKQDVQFANNQEEIQRAQQEAAARAQQEAVARAQQEAAARAQQEAAARAQQEAAARAQQEAAARAQQEATARAQQEAAARAQQEAAARSQQEQAFRAQQEAMLRAQQEAATRAQQEAQIQAQQQAEAARAQQEAMFRAQQEAATKAQMEAQAQEEAKRLRDEKFRAQQEAYIRAQQEGKERRDISISRDDNGPIVDNSLFTNNQFANSYTNNSIPDGYVNNTNIYPNIDEISEPAETQYTGPIIQAPSDYKKVVAFVGTNKVGTTFMVNVIGTLMAQKGVKTSILDMTKSRGMYWFYEKTLSRQYDQVSTCMTNLGNGIVTPLEIGKLKNLNLFTTVPQGREDNVKSYRSRAVTDLIRQNCNLLLIDCDISNTPIEYFEVAQDIFLVQDFDAIKIIETKEFLRKLSESSIPWDKMRLIINNSIKCKSINGKRLRKDALTWYQDTSHSRTEDFPEIKRFIEIPMNVSNYSNYIDSMPNERVNFNGFTEDFKKACETLSQMVYGVVGFSSKGKKKGLF